MEQYSDEELVRLYVDTQRNIYFERLYERYCDKVYRKCLSFTKDPVRAEDLTHDIFLKLVIKLGSFREQAKFSTWLYSITYNYCTDQIRTQNMRKEVYMEDGWERLDIQQDDDLGDLAEMEAKQLERALHQLPPEEQSMLLMKYQDDISIRDIANINGLTESAVKMRLKRSRDKLRKHYLEGVVFWLLLAIKMILSIRWPFR
ncbi:MULTISPECIES: RNA polymerase sigma factor [unclassified Spirosoma]|uniref:RNA polymerase sigma factor n=1 Tax=unclassified Spirosoma TaxID=2621999 RepID=UPI00095A0D66|nr:MULTISPECIES: RNA polymerase sigma factor [unclassified Spirosoma]MBN8824721.1 RNA polymerase sigma factor [Spirosoma sp.]OJW78736.1 MAG: RNA polymerase subunit sigma-24 [Spirosoma sp. 48-14]